MTAVSTATPFKNTTEGTKLVTANTKFALELYLKQSAAGTKNVFISPLSISVALAMAYAGAREKTKSQMKDALEFGEVEENHLHEAFRDLRSKLDRADKADRPSTLYMPNRIFSHKTCTLLDDFLLLCREHYFADLAPVDFR